MPHYECNTCYQMPDKCTCNEPLPAKASSHQVGGNHYTSMGIQPLEYTYANYGYMGMKAAIHTKVNKYLGRVKDDEVQQLEKAKHCIELLIEKAKLL